MKWIFAFSQGSEPLYEPLIRVAVTSARKFTSLEAICLYDGEPTPLTRWLEAQHVNVVRACSSFVPNIEELARHRNDLSVLHVGRGAFLRLELPRVAREQGWSDEFVFYTDCDVMFERDPTPLLKPLRPRFFAAAPEHDPNSPLHMNSGAMWVNLREFAMQSETLKRWTGRNFSRVWDAAWDQGALRVYFHPLHRFLWRVGVPDRVGYGLLTRLPFRGWKWDDLPIELNWKPYWGLNDNAAVVHFHGPKPNQRGALDRSELPPHLSQLDGSGFRAYAAHWDEWLKEAQG